MRQDEQLDFEKPNYVICKKYADDVLKIESILYEVSIFLLYFLYCNVYKCI